MGRDYVWAEQATGFAYIADRFTERLGHVFDPMNDAESWELVAFWMAVHFSSDDFDRYLAAMVDRGITIPLHQFTAVPSAKTMAFLKAVDEAAYEKYVGKVYGG